MMVAPPETDKSYKRFTRSMDKLPQFREMIKAFTRGDYESNQLQKEINLSALIDGTILRIGSPGSRPDLWRYSEDHGYTTIRFDTKDTREDTKDNVLVVPATEKRETIMVYGRRCMEGLVNVVLNSVKAKNNNRVRGKATQFLETEAGDKKKLEVMLMVAGVIGNLLNGTDIERKLRSRCAGLYT